MTAVGDRVDTFAQDVRYAWRSLRRSRAFAAWVVASLAIGMAVAIAALALLLETLVGPFPHVSEQHRLVRVAAVRNCGGPDCWVRMASPADYDALQDGFTGLESLAAYTTGQVSVGLPEARSMRSLVVSANYFEVLGVRPALGRMFRDADGDAGAGVAVLSHRLWTQEFAGDPAVIGRTIRVADEFVRVVGVAPEFFVGIDFRPARGDLGPDLWLPLWLADPILPLTATEQRRGERDLALVGRLDEGVTVARLQTEADVLARRLAASREQGTFPPRGDVARVWRTRPENWGIGVVVVMPIPLLVLVIACVNAASLMLARASQRRREIVTRLAMGARRSRIVRQLLLESGVLTLVATAVAVPIAWLALRMASTPLILPIPLNLTVLVFTIVIAAAVTLGFGLAPAVRVSAQPLSSVMGSPGSRNDGHPASSKMRGALLTMQVALSLALLTTAWQLVSTVQAQAVSGGTPADRLLVARFDLRSADNFPGESERFFAELGERVSRLPGVEATGLARHTAVWTFGQGAGPASMIVWTPADDPDDGRITIGGYAGGDLFQALGLRTLAGRAFAAGDRQGRPDVALVNQSFAEAMAGPALGSVLRVAARDGAFESSIDVRVVGIVEAVVEPRLEQDGPPGPRVYLPSPIEPEPALALYVRTRGPAAALAQPVRELTSEIAPRVPVSDLASLQELNERSYAPQLWLARAAAALGTVGLLLAAAGLYGVTSYVVAIRSRDIAIRMAIGAKPNAILRMILSQAMRVAIIGLLAGAAVGVAVSQIIQSEYHGIRAMDGSAFGGSAALFVLVMLVASLVPAIRAARVDPIETLKDA
jgi:putative ABC transport system permease protein